MLAVVASLDDIRGAFRSFTEEREWAQFHDPKSLLLALVGEVGELAELYQWLPAEEASERARVEPLKSRSEQELADVFIYLVALADVLGVDLLAAAASKLDAARQKYPAEQSRGVAPDRALS